MLNSNIHPEQRSVDCVRRWIYEYQERKLIESIYFLSNFYSDLVNSLLLSTVVVEYINLLAKNEVFHYQFVAIFIV